MMVKPEFKPFSIIATGAERFSIISDGKQFIDFSGSAMTTGYNFISADWLMPTVSRLVFDNPYTRELTESLKSMSGFQNVVYSTSGTEACDTALSRYGKPIIALEGAYHGLTYLTRVVSNGTGYDRLNNVLHIRPPSRRFSLPDALEYNDRIIAESLPGVTGGTIILELIQSDGGVNVLTEPFVKYLVDLARDRDMHLIVDEVYTGYGRSGEMLLSKKYHLEPDMICLGKGMAAGLPLGAILYDGEWDLPYNQVVSMQAANMFVSRVAVRVTEALTDNVLQQVRQRGRRIIERLSEIHSSRISEVRGMGFMIGVELKDKDGNPDGKYALSVREYLARRGVICSLTGEYNNVLKITPPVLIDDGTLYRGIEIIEKVFEGDVD